MAEIFANNLSTTLASPALDSDTTLALTDATGWPEPTGGDFHRATLVELDGDGAEVSWEVVLVTGRSGTTLTVTRAQEGTAAQNWPADTVIQIRPTAGWAAAVESGLAGKAATSHTHAAADITSGQLAMARIASGTPDGTKFVRDDGVLATPAGGGGDGLVYPDSAPSSPSAFDDEFTEGTLDAKWEATANVGNGAGHVITPNKYDSWLSLAGPGSATGTERRYTRRQTLSGLTAGTAFTVWTRVAVRARIPVNTRILSYLWLSNNATFGSGSQVGFGVTETGSELAIEVYNGSTFDLQLNLAAGVVGPVYLLMTRTTGNVCDLFYSLDGFSWRRINQVTRNWDAAYCYVDVTTGNAAANPGEGMMDFVRFNDPRIVIPS